MSKFIKIDVVFRSFFLKIGKRNIESFARNFDKFKEIIFGIEMKIICEIINVSERLAAVETVISPDVMRIQIRFNARSVFS